MLVEYPLKLKEGRRIRGVHLNYRIISPIGRGGSGVVYKAQCEETHALVAIKFFLPLYELNLSLFDTSHTQQAALEDLREFFKKELQCLQEVQHPAIVRVYDNGTHRTTQGDLVPQLRSVQQVDFFVMEFVPGRNIAEHLLSEKVTKATVVAIFCRVCDALSYLHEVKQYMHADIRSTNIIVREATSEPVLLDFALYKNFNPTESNQDEITRLYGDWDLFPKDLPLDDPLKRFKETKGTRAALRDLCFPGLDMFQVGKLLQSLSPQLNQCFSGDELRYLAILKGDLGNWSIARQRSARWLREQFAKLEPSYSHFMGVEELTPPSSARQTLQLPGRVIATSELIDKLANTRSFRRLRSINQLALIDLLYPGAGYRRHLHCLRAYGYCADLIESLAHSPRFRFWFDPILARQALVLALLHDINHFPFLHVFQEARGEYLRDIDLFDLFCNGKATQDAPSLYELLEQIGLSRQSFRDILLLEHDKLAELGYQPGLQIAKSMIDSGADEYFLIQE